MFTDVIRPLMRAWRAVLIASITMTSSGCAAFYLDSALRDVPASEYSKPAAPQAVQLLFTFQSKGVANAKGTEFLKNEVNQVINGSGLFGSLSTEPVPGGAILNVIINNVPGDDAAFAKGFGTGLTFGLVGTKVTDGYICTIDYVPAADGSKLTKEARHAIYTTVGAKGAPENATKAPNINAAVTTMTRQIVGQALKELSTTPGFK